MQARTLLALTLGLGFAACGLETVFANAGNKDQLRPASRLYGTVSLPIPNPDTAVLTVNSGAFNEITPFEYAFDGGAYDLKLPSSNYTNLILTLTSGNVRLYSFVPEAKEESSTRVDISSATTTEYLISAARLSTTGDALTALNPKTYLATRALIQSGFISEGPTKDLLAAVDSLTKKYYDPAVTSEPVIFNSPVLDAGYSTTTSALDQNWVKGNSPDVLGNGERTDVSVTFDKLLAEAAMLYRPAGCPDPTNVRSVFTVNFAEGQKDGNCATLQRFKWAVDKPGKSMFFVGWIHKDSPVQDSNVAALMGNGVPNQIPMYDDGTNGDEVAGDSIWTVTFDLPIGTRIGYKYTWGFRGAVWTGSEEWPGNSHILAIKDVNGDGFVYRRDNFGDEATNKDASNSSIYGSGTITWDTILRPAFGIEAQEQMVDTDNDCKPNIWVRPTAIGPLTVACTQ